MGYDHMKHIYQIAAASLLAVVLIPAKKPDNPSSHNFMANDNSQTQLGNDSYITNDNFTLPSLSKIKCEDTSHVFAPNHTAFALDDDMLPANGLVLIDVEVYAEKPGSIGKKGTK